MKIRRILFKVLSKCCIKNAGCKENKNVVKVGFNTRKNGTKEVLEDWKVPCSVYRKQKPFISEEYGYPTIIGDREEVY